MVISTCNKIDGHLPKPLLMKMSLRAIFDWVIGLIPILGDVLDAVYKCNVRNVRSLEEYLEKRGQSVLAEHKKVAMTNGGAMGEP
jgi:hypothetical protein